MERYIRMYIIVLYVKQSVYTLSSFEWKRGVQEINAYFIPRDILHIADCVYCMCLHTTKAIIEEIWNRFFWLRYLNKAAVSIKHQYQTLDYHFMNVITLRFIWILSDAPAVSCNWLPVWWWSLQLMRRQKFILVLWGNRDSLIDLSVICAYTVKYWWDNSLHQITASKSVEPADLLFRARVGWWGRGMGGFLTAKRQ